MHITKTENVDLIHSRIAGSDIAVILKVKNQVFIVAVSPL